MKKHLAVTLLLALMAPLALMPAKAQQEDVRQRRSTAKFHRKGNRAIPNHYIVILLASGSSRKTR